jgi:hypothetical protein
MHFILIFAIFVTAVTIWMLNRVFIGRGIGRNHLLMVPVVERGVHAMKKKIVIATAVIGLALAAPVSAHHNCAAGDACPEEIGDLMENHAAAIDELREEDMGGQMDPADVDEPNQAGGGAEDLPGLSRPGAPDPEDSPGGEQDRNWGG